MICIVRLPVNPIWLSNFSKLVRVWVLLGSAPLVSFESLTTLFQMEQGFQLYQIRAILPSVIPFVLLNA